MLDLWRDSLDIASGPFRFVSWQRGTQLVLARNTAFTAGPKSKLDRVVFRFIPSTPSLFQALESDEIQVAEPQPQLPIAELRKNSRFRVQSGPGYLWEHLDIQFGAKGHPALRRPYVRHALITGINRAQIREALYVRTGLVASAKELPVLQSHIFMPFEDGYRQNWARWTFSQRNAATSFTLYGCGGDLNYMSYCDTGVTALLRRAQFTPDAKARAALLNRAEGMMAQDVPSIPLFARPGFLVNNRKLSGTILNPTNQGSTWNSHTWAVAA